MRRKQINKQTHDSNKSQTKINIDTVEQTTQTPHWGLFMIVCMCVHCFSHVLTQCHSVGQEMLFTQICLQSIFTPPRGPTAGVALTVRASPPPRAPRGAAPYLVLFVWGICAEYIYIYTQRIYKGGKIYIWGIYKEYINIYIYINKYI